MNLFEIVSTGYGQFIDYFPSHIQWLVTLLIVIGLVGGLVRLIMHNALFIILAIVLLPFVVPVVSRFITDLHGVFGFMVDHLGFKQPQNQR